MAPPLNPPICTRIPPESPANPIRIPIIRMIHRLRLRTREKPHNSFKDFSSELELAMGASLCHTQMKPQVRHKQARAKTATDPGSPLSDSPPLVGAVYRGLRLMPPTLPVAVCYYLCLSVSVCRFRLRPFRRPSMKIQLWFRTSLIRL